MLVKQRLRQSVLDTWVYRGANLDSDHHLVIVPLRSKLAKKTKQMTGQFLSRHVAVKQIEGKTFRPRRSSSVTIQRQSSYSREKGLMQNSSSK